MKFVVARFDEGNYSNYLRLTLKNVKNAMCLDVHASGEDITKGLAEKYNKGLETVKQNLDDRDIVGFIHEDVKIIDKNLSQKIEKVFEQKPDIGMVGVLGASELPENGNWFMIPEKKIYGQWIQEHNGETLHMTKGQVGYYDNVVVVHKFCFFVRGSLIKEGLMFDNRFQRHDLYNIDLGLQVLERGYKLAVADILLLHKSIREGNTNIGLLTSKWKEKGKTFPLTTDQFTFKEIKQEQVVEVEI